MNKVSGHILVKDLYLTLGNFCLKKIDLEVNPGDYHMLLGPSGSGKSSLMKCLLGFYRIDRGMVWLGARNITNERPEKRRMGYVPQNYALFSHMNVEENIRYGMKAANLTNHQAAQYLNRLLGIMGIENLRLREVDYLSGGEKQKVALGRALGMKPETILLDEPFSAIDEDSKRRLWFELKQVINEVGVTTLHITHNLEEAETLGDRLTLLINGEIVQSGKREELFEHPVNERVARYLNYRNIFYGVIRDYDDHQMFVSEHFSVSLNRKFPSNIPVTLCIRQQDIKIVRDNVPLKEELSGTVFSGEIVELFQLSEYSLMWFKIDTSPNKYDFEVKFPSFIDKRLALFTGKRIKVAFWESRVIIFENERR
ncbi:MAG: ABC transporter ATP-binding protein [Candidatus Omnitrophota bacterium]